MKTKKPWEPYTVSGIFFEVTCQNLKQGMVLLNTSANNFCEKSSPISMRENHV